MARGRIPRRTKLNIPMCMAGVLFCLTLFSLHFSSGVIARYSANTDGTDNARVIEFNPITLTETGDIGNYNGKNYVYPGAVLKWNAAVRFPSRESATTGSESATYVFLEVQPTGNVAWSVQQDADTKVCTYTTLEHNNGQAGLTWVVADGWTQLSSNENIYYRTLAPNEKLINAPVIQNGEITVAETVTAADLKTIPADFGLCFGASVVQSNGFDSPEAAWESLVSKGQTVFDYTNTP